MPLLLRRFVLARTGQDPKGHQGGAPALRDGRTVPTLAPGKRTSTVTSRLALAPPFSLTPSHLTLVVVGIPGLKGGRIAPGARLPTSYPRYTAVAGLEGERLEAKLRP